MTKETDFIHANEQEVLDAYNSLTEEELVKLERLASRRNYFPDPGYTGVDFVNDVLIKFLLLKRKWPKNKTTFFKAVWGVIVSESSNRAKHIKTKNGDLEYKLVQVNIGEDNNLDDYLSDIAPNCEILVNKKLTLEKVKEHFQNDKEVYDILEALLADFSIKEIKEVLGISQTEYETRKRKLDRHIEKLIKEWEET